MARYWAPPKKADASKPEQIIECAASIDNLEFTDAELKEIDQHAKDQNINLWAKSSETD